ncbi:MAG: HAD-IIIC family phosphatase [Chloroflexi bacterium]|nr:HAD-IIIC family phosphatase [Chloroflexota bacterium]
MNNFPLPSHPTLGALDAQSPGHEVHAVLQLNADLMADCAELRDVYVVDLMRVVARIGSEHVIDQRYWHVAAAPLTRDGLRGLGREYGRYIRALRGSPKKCLVVDCDNTLWGGILGEDGLSGIQLGTSYPGACFRAFQQDILNLQQRGILLAIASKNNEEDVLHALREHPDGVLREEHFATWAISWQDKVTQLRDIAADLNIGLDSLVFVDDNPFEINLIRQKLPEVTVLQVPSSPALLQGWLPETGLFDSLTFSSEDRQRTDMYRTAREREHLAASAADISEYLSQLGIEADIDQPSKLEIARVAQLTQKTNQFNLTTRRYTEGQIDTFISRDDVDVLRLRVRDKISDLGLVGVAILAWRDAATVEVDSLLLSCRALGRGVEDAFIRHVAHGVRQRGAEILIGRFLPTAKNAQCVDYYPRNGFQLEHESGSETTWCLRLDNELLALPEWISLTHDALIASQ